MSATPKKRGVFVDRRAGETLTINGVEVHLESAGSGKARLLCVAGDGDKITFTKTPATERVSAKPTSIAFKRSR